MGNGGQTSSNFLTGLLNEQMTRRFRRCGDPNITFRHLRHTCTSVHHLFSSSTTRKSNISRRTSSGRMSIVTQANDCTPLGCCCRIGQRKTYVDSVQFVCSKSRNLHRYFLSANRSLESYRLSALVIQGGHETMVSRGPRAGYGSLGGSEDGDALEHGYLRHLSVIIQRENSPDIQLRTHR